MAIAMTMASLTLKLANISESLLPSLNQALTFQRHWRRSTTGIFLSFLHCRPAPLLQEILGIPAPPPLAAVIGGLFTHLRSSFRPQLVNLLAPAG